MKKIVFLNNPPTKKVVTHFPIFRLEIVSPLHWPFVRNILFSLTLLQEGCVLDSYISKFIIGLVHVVILREACQKKQKNRENKEFGIPL